MGQKYSFTKLPNNAQVLALKMFDNIELIAFSLLSNRTLTLAKSLNRKADVRLVIGRDVRVEFGSTRLIFCYNGTPKLHDVDIPTAVEIEVRSWFRNNNLVRENMAMELKAWMQHIMELFNRSSLDQIIITSDHRFPLNGIYSLLLDLKVVVLDFIFLSTPTIQAPSLLSPSQALRFGGGNPFKKSIEIQKMLLQNVPLINVFNFENFQLNDLLSCNCRQVIARPVRIPAKQMRRWLKLWENGANSRLKSMNFGFYSTDPEIDWFVENLVQYTELSREVCLEYVHEEDDVRKGFELWRKDRRGMAHAVVTREEEMNRVLCAIRMKVFN